MGSEGFRNWRGSTGYSPSTGETQELVTNKLLSRYFPQLVDKIDRIQALPQQTIIDIDTSGVVQAVTTAMDSIQESNEIIAANQSAIGLKAIESLDLTYGEIRQLNAQEQRAYKQRGESIQKLRDIESSIDRLIAAVREIQSEIADQGNIISDEIADQGNIISDEISQAREEVSQELRTIQDIGLLSHIQNRALLSQISEVLTHLPEKQVLLQAKLLMQYKEYSAAYHLLKSIILSDISNAEIWYELAVCSMHLGNRTEALEFVKGVIKIAKTGKNKHLARAIVTDKLFDPIKPQIEHFLQTLTT